MTAPTLFIPERIKPAKATRIPGLFEAFPPVTDSPARWLRSDGGIEVEQRNLIGATNSADSPIGFWIQDWLTGETTPPDAVKWGQRPDQDLPQFGYITLWTYDQTQCADLTAESRRESHQRAVDLLELNASRAVEVGLTVRLLNDAPVDDSAADIVAGVAYLEGLLAGTGLLGVLHADPRFNAVAVQTGVAIRSGDHWITPQGHRWLFAPGYHDTLGTTIVATSAEFIIRQTALVDESDLQHQQNYQLTVVERSYLVGYEYSVGKVEIG